MSPDNPLHIAFHHADFIAMLFTQSGSAILAVWKHRAGWALIGVGAVLWAVVGLWGSWAGRPIVGIVASSVCSLAWAVIGWKRWH